MAHCDPCAKERRRWNALHQQLTFPGQGVGIPKFMFSVSPTTKLDSPEARKTYADARSAGWPDRPNGVSRPYSGSWSVGYPPDTCNAVQVGPGATTLTRMPRGASCWDNALEKLLVAALVVA